MDGVLEQADLPSLAFQDSVLDGPTVNTRAGLYVYLNALVYLTSLGANLTDFSSLQDDLYATML